MAVAVCAAPAAQAAAPPGQITQSMIGGVGLGLRTADYVRLLHEHPFVTHYNTGTSRLWFPKAEIDVLLGPNGRGLRLSTAAHEYTLKGGVGPCARFAAVSRRYRLVRYEIAGPFGPSGVVYRLGRLWFTLTATRRIGRIALSASTPVLSSLTSESQCGVGEGEGG